MFKIYLIPLVLISAFFLGSKYGSTKVQSKWDAQNALYERRIHELELRRTSLESDLRSASESLTERLRAQETSHETAIALIHSDYADRLSKQEARLTRYQYLSNDSKESRVCLAEHAGKLDAALEEGRVLVRQYRQFAEEWRVRLDMCQTEWESLRSNINGN